MGKIFDALEKSSKQKDADLPIFKQNEVSEIKESTSAKVVPLVNTLKAPEMSLKLVTYHAPQSIEADLFKVLRTNILFPDSGMAPRTILVTSAMPGDGKSFISSNLAVSIAQGVEDHVLLIDCDLRKPSLHTYFGYGAVSGLSEYLSVGSPLSQLLLKTDLPKLNILPAGHPTNNPTELLTSKKMKNMLEEVKRRYDDRFIIIDSPPPSMAAEAAAIIKYVDGVIMVIKSDKSPRNAVAETIEQIGKEKIIGIVLNYSSQRVKKYYGYDKSYYNKGSKK